MRRASITAGRNQRAQSELLSPEFQTERLPENKGQKDKESIMQELTQNGMQSFKERSILRSAPDALQGPRLKTNLDTGFIKLIAIIAMTIDHIGGAFFPQYPAFRWIGRIAFPLFSYCLTVGMLYTRDIKKYALRLTAFALISQPFWILAFNADDILGNLFNLNIFFTLLVSLLSAWGFKERKWRLFFAGVLLLNLVNFDYAMTGLILMLIFYLCRNKPWLGALLYTLSYLPAVNGYMEDPLALKIGSHAMGFEIFALLALPFIYLHTNVNPKIPKWFFYCYYPAHLFLIFLIGLPFGTL